MPEEGLETSELKEALDEAQHHAHGHGHGEEGKGHGGIPTWIGALSLSTAIIAVLAAVASLYSGSYANEAILDKNQAIHKQAEASDIWAQYQAKGIKSNLLDSQVKMLKVVAAKTDDPALAAERAAVEAEFTKKIKVEEEKKAEASKTAKEHEAERDEANAESDHKFHTHHLFAYAVTVFQVSIALSAIAALTRKKFVWFLSLAVGAGAIAFLSLGFKSAYLTAPEGPATHAEPKGEGEKKEHGAKPAEGEKKEHGAKHEGEKPAEKKE